VNQQNAPLNQHKIAEVGSAKPSNGAGWRAVNQLNQLNQHYFCLLSEKKQRLTERGKHDSTNFSIRAAGGRPQTRTTGKGTAWLWPGWRYRCRAMPQRTGRLPSGWASLPLGNRPMRWQDTLKAI
jgi:hypothetical protein